MTGILPEIKSADDILGLLPLVADRGWAISGHGRIRDRDGRCPICAIVHELSDGAIDHRDSAYTALRQLAEIRFDPFARPGYSVVSDVMCAADGYGTTENRSKMLAYLNLTGSTDTV